MRSVVLSVAIVLTAASAAMAQNGRSAPTGAEIAQKARAARFDAARAGKGVFEGKPMKLTPAVLNGVGLEDLKAGQVVGLLENGAAGDETGLPPGRYDLFLSYVGQQWHAYAEANGKVVAEAIRTSVTEGSAPATQFQPKGWCFDIVVYLTPFWWHVCF